MIFGIHVWANRGYWALIIRAGGWGDRYSSDLYSCKQQDHFAPPPPRFKIQLVSELAWNNSFRLMVIPDFLLVLCIYTLRDTFTMRDTGTFNVGGQRAPSTHQKESVGLYGQGVPVWVWRGA